MILSENIKYNPKMRIIKDMIHTLYELPECCSGGCCHIVTDDGNILDCHLEFVINYCKENPDSIDTELSAWICELMLQLTLEQRAALFVVMEKEIDFDESCWNTLVDCYRLDIKEFLNDQCG